jgi:hypothetical protein
MVDDLEYKLSDGGLSGYASEQDNHPRAYWVA